MSKTIIALIVAGSLFLFGLLTSLYVINTYNTQGTLLNSYNMKIKDNSSEFDNMWKKISQTTQVTKYQQDSLKEIFNGYAAARTGNSNGGEVMKWITESIPNVDTTTFRNLQNIIIGSRDNWTMRQKELVGIAEEYNRNLSVFPSNIMLKIFGFKILDPKVITSNRTQEAFDSGVDNDTKLELK